MRNTGVMCMVHVGDRNIDMGNYFTDENGARCLITSRELAEKYGHLVSFPVYVRRPTKYAPDAASAASAEPDSGLESVPAVESDTQPRG